MPLQSDYKSGPGFVRFAGPSSADLAGAGRVQIGVDDPVSDATLLTVVTAHARRGDVRLFTAQHGGGGDPVGQSRCDQADAGDEGRQGVGVHAETPSTRLQLLPPKPNELLSAWRKARSSPCSW